MIQVMGRVQVVLEHLVYSEKNGKFITGIFCKKKKKKLILLVRVSGPRNIELVAQFNNGERVI